MKQMFYRAEVAQLTGPGTAARTGTASVLGNSPGDMVLNWDVRKVTDFVQMFEKAYEADPDVAHWNTESAITTAMHFMFKDAAKARATTGPDWNTENCLTLEGMFMNAVSADPRFLTNWSVQKVTDMKDMFFNANSATLEPTSSNDGTLPIR
jgi:hypothetical protein